MKRRILTLHLWLLWLGLLLLSAGALAAVPETLSYQGYLTDAGGTPLPTPTSLNITFRLYNESNGAVANAKWSETQSVAVSQGLFSVQLGSGGNPLPAGLFDDPSNPIWLGIEVESDGEMSPRKLLTAAAYAVRAQQAEIDADTLANLICAPTQVAKFDGSAWVCATDDTGSSDWSSLTNVPSGFSDGTDDGITEEVDPTVPSTIKDGIAWTEVSGRPAGLDDGDDVGLLAETDPQVGSNTTNRIPKWNGSALVSGSIFDNGNVGIGISNPQAILEVRDLLRVSDSTASGDYISLSTLSDALDFNAFNHPLRINNISGQNTYIMGGNVGIGTTTPADKLHVNGLARFDLNGGSIRMSTPGNNPGMIMFDKVNGHRRDMTIYDSGLGLTVSQTNQAPPDTAGLFIHENGNVGFGTKAPGHKVDVNGRVRTKTLEITGGADLSEQFDINDGVDLLKPAPGMLVSIDPDHAGALVISDHAYNRRVAGVISGAGDVAPGMIMGHSGTLADGAHPVALSGRVYCFAETSSGTIEPGDLLTSSDIPGYAMKVTDYKKAQGAVIGKAMTRLDTERGQVLVLVSLQ